MSPRPARRVAGLEKTLIRKLFESLEGDELNLGLGQVDLAVPPPLVEALAAAAGRTGRYGATAGDLELRAAVAGSYRGFAGGPEDVVVTAGCQQATFAVLGALADAGTRILVPEPGFPGAARAAAAWGAIPRPYPLRAENGFRVDPNEVLALADETCRGIVVISPSNPTGAVERDETLATLAAGCARRGIALILDDTYRDFSWRPGEASAPGPPEGHPESVVVCGGLSKSPGLASWRIGWIVSPDSAFMARVAALMQTIHTCPAGPTQVAARAAFAPEGAQAASRLRETFLRRRDIVLEGLAETHDAGPLEGGFYAWVRTPSDAETFARELLEEERIVVVPGVAFGAACTDRMRVSYACDDAMLRRAVAVIARRLS